MSRIALPFVTGLIGTAILLWLGFWQLDRLDQKQAILTEIETRIVGEPAPRPAPGAAEPQSDR